MLLTGCSDPTSLGSDLLEEDVADIDILDTFTIQARTVPGEAVATFSPFTALNAYMVSNVNDPIFGTTVAETFIQPRLEFTNPFFEDAQADSIVLMLAFDTASFYGDLDQPYTLNIHRVTEFMDPNDTYFSDTTVQFDLNPLGSVTFTPGALDTVQYLDYAQGVPIPVTDVVMRATLDPNLARELISLDSSVYQSDTSFVRNFNGLALRAQGPGSASISFDMLDNRSGMYLYYRRDTLFRQYRYTLGNFGTKIVRFEHDYSGSAVANALNSQPGDNDSLLYCQGMAGTNVAIRFPDLSDLDNVIVNSAELVVSSRVLPEDNPEHFEPAAQIVAFVRNEEGELETLDDVVLATNNIPQRFGGTPEKSDSGVGVVYRFNVSTHLQGVIDGEQPEEIILSAFPRPESPGRVVLQNPATGADRIRLRLTVTKLNE